MLNENLPQVPVFVITAEGRGPSSRKTQFLIQAESHREAWRAAREVAKTGKGAYVRDPVTQKLEPYDLEPGQLTVRSVLSTNGSRRGRPPKLNTDQLLTLAESRGVRVSKAVQRVINELQAN